MIAGPDHRTPPSLRNDKDWARFQAALDVAAIVVLGRIGHEAHPNPGRRRLVLTRRVATLASDPGDANATLWNPEGLAWDAAARQLGLADGIVAVTGGQMVFDLFLSLFTGFDLVEAANVTIPGGIACFSSADPVTALTGAGLAVAEVTPLDPGVTLSVWKR